MFAEHPVEVKDGHAAGGDRRRAPDVTSHHHQGLGRVGEGLVETAWADDGTLEGVEDPSLRFAVGVQWHPEAGEDDGALRDARRGGARVPRSTQSAVGSRGKSSREERVYYFGGLAIYIVLSVAVHRGRPA